MGYKKGAASPRRERVIANRWSLLLPTTSAWWPLTPFVSG